MESPSRSNSYHNEQDPYVECEKGLPADLWRPIAIIASTDHATAATLAKILGNLWIICSACCEHTLSRPTAGPHLSRVNGEGHHNVNIIIVIAIIIIIIIRLKSSRCSQ